MLEYSEEQLDMMKEVSNIALGNSATSLSELLNTRITMTIPNVHIESISDFMDEVDDIEVIGKILILKGDIEGSVLLLFDINTAKNIVKDIASGQLMFQDELDDVRISFIEEVCNIVCSTYIRNIADYFNLRIEIESSSLLYDNLTAILSYTLMEEEQFYDEILNINTDFKYELETEMMNVYFYFVPRKGNLNKIFKSKSQF
ncbi:chemotaxis protein CheC [Candidatus Arthromitus sp. SFB-rat-Yit]|uniref:chemotaxis protein CheC n=1 Tax=Candidatus Arthromitus sp. SFB-rat-Yit TaxID=1041504 RepID=UPI000227A5D0|nr:chemotaxis protein CheC [Candidatus Arthromitus sp. SFB-rat-Yit]BAK81033.1 chemotaxis protein CheC [Candidatus Arthromitus sp. SFB-rat-Yit]